MNVKEIKDPAFLRRMDEKELQKLCGELREFIIEGVSHTGGHLSSNLGLVELTVALHRVFEVPRDKLIFDVGHQCYTHKLLTGRKERFSTLRQENGLSGFTGTNIGCQRALRDTYSRGFSIGATLPMTPRPAMFDCPISKKECTIFFVLRLPYLRANTKSRRID